jgi:hypothetical protein
MKELVIVIIVIKIYVTSEMILKEWHHDNSQFF